jgi:hypothetical protein
MHDAEASRQTAHIFLDAASVQFHDGDDDERDDMRGLALRRLQEVGSIQILRDDETGALSLDIRAAQTGIVAVILACLHGWAASSGADLDALITEVRNIIDAELTD